jgi:hypothetical protein
MPSETQIQPVCVCYLWFVSIARGTFLLFVCRLYYVLGMEIIIRNKSINAENSSYYSVQKTAYHVLLLESVEYAANKLNIL